MLSPSLSTQHSDTQDAGTVDGDFIISVFDAALPFLDSIGSHEQWGSTPFSHRKGWAEETLQQIRDSEHYRLTGAGDASRIFIVEREWPPKSAEILDVNQVHSRVAVDGQRFLAVGFAFVRENWIPSYIMSQHHLHIGDAERESAVYFEVLATDRRVGSLGRGAGVVLIRGVRNYSRSRQKQMLYMDGWAGNEKKLVRFIFAASAYPWNCKT
ncbi:MAG: hypothetical protein M1818_004898 [Claussenomyces sp. TS43310]|nr:MAG: hypothetical protein M1818_004898 [Claussenomyces sp. TS43310]